MIISILLKQKITIIFFDFMVSLDHLHYSHDQQEDNIHAHKNSIQNEYQITKENH